MATNGAMAMATPKPQRCLCKFYTHISKFQVFCSLRHLPISQQSEITNHNFCICKSQTHMRYGNAPFLFMFVMQFVYGPKINFCMLAQMWFVTRFLVAGAEGWLTARQPTKNQALLPSLSTHLLVSGVQKKSLLGVGGVFLTRGKWEVKVLAQGEATARGEAAAGASRGGGGATRGDATTSWGK